MPTLSVLILDLSNCAPNINILDLGDTHHVYFCADQVTSNGYSRARIAYYRTTAHDG